MATKTTKKRAKKASGAGGAAATALAAAAAGAAAGYYFYATENAKRHRHAASAWAKGLRKDVQERVKSLKKIDGNAIARVVDDAAAAYKDARGVAMSDVATAAHELKRNWPRVIAELAPSRRITRVVKKATTKAKKVVKKAKKTAPKKRAKKKTKSRRR